MTDPYKHERNDGEQVTNEVDLRNDKNWLLTHLVNGIEIRQSLSREMVLVECCSVDAIHACC